MLHTIGPLHRQRRQSRFSPHIIVYSILLVITLCKSSTQQLEPLAIKTDPFYIDLQHKFGSSGEFRARGSIFVRPKTDYRSAQASFVQPQAELTDSDLKLLNEASDRGDTYYLKASIRKKKADTNDNPSKVTQTIVKSCSLHASNLADTLVINLNPLNDFININLFTTDQECASGPPPILSNQFNTTLLIDSGSVGPQPDTATYIKRLEEERQSKLKEGKEDNRSFLAKYWIYIVPAVIILMMMGGPEQGARIGLSRSRQLATDAAASAATGQSKLYDQHIPLTGLQKILLSIGSGVTAIIDPYRHDLVADFGETTGHQALRWMHNKMLADDEGKQILNDKPRLRSDRVDYERLKSLPHNTFGHHYSRFYTDNGVSPDTRKQVQFVDDSELAYVMQRYRELHDIVHTILNQPTTIKGEVIVKAFEGAQTRLPLCILGGLIGPLRLNRLENYEYLTKDLPWALKCGSEARFLMNVYFEKRFEQDIDDLRKELNIRLK